MLVATLYFVKFQHWFFEIKVKTVIAQPRSGIEESARSSKLGIDNSGQYLAPPGRLTGHCAAHGPTVGPTLLHDPAGSSGTERFGSSAPQPFEEGTHTNVAPTDPFGVRGLAPGLMRHARPGCRERQAVVPAGLL